MPDSPRLSSPVIPVASFSNDAPLPSPSTASAATSDSDETPSGAMNRKVGQLAAKNLYAQQGQEDIPPAEHLAGQIEKVYKEMKKMGLFTPKAYGQDKPMMVESGELCRSELFLAGRRLNELLEQAENDPAGKVQQPDKKLRRELKSQTKKYKKICEENQKSIKDLRQEKEDLGARQMSPFKAIFFLEGLKKRLDGREQEFRELRASIDALSTVPASSEKIEYINQLLAVLRTISEDRAWTYFTMLSFPGRLEIDFSLRLAQIEEKKSKANSSSNDLLLMDAILDLKKKVIRELPGELPEMWSRMVFVWDAIRLIAEDEKTFEENKDVTKAMISEAVCMHSKIPVIIEYPGAKDLVRTKDKIITGISTAKEGERFFRSREENDELISRAELAVLAETDDENLPWSSRFFQEFRGIRALRVKVRLGALSIFVLQGRQNPLNDQGTRELLLKLAPKLDEAADNFDILKDDLADTLALYEQEIDESGEPASASALTRERGELLIADLTLHAAALREEAFNYRVYARCLGATVSMERERHIDIEEEETILEEETPAAESVVSPQEVKNETVDETPPIAPVSPVEQKSREEAIKELDALLQSADENVKVAARQLELHLTNEAITPYGHAFALNAAISAHLAAASDYADAKKIQRVFNFPGNPDATELEQDELDSYSEAVLLSVYAKHPLSAFGPASRNTLKILDKEGGVQVIRSKKAEDYFFNLGTEANPEWMVENFLKLSTTVRSEEVKATKTIKRLMGFHAHVVDGLNLDDLKFIRPDQIQYIEGKGRKGKPRSHTKLLSQLRVSTITWKRRLRQAAAQGRKINTFSRVKQKDIPRDYAADIIRRGAQANPEKINLGRFTKKF